MNPAILIQLNGNKSSENALSDTDLNVKNENEKIKNNDSLNPSESNNLNRASEINPKRKEFFYFIYNSNYSEISKYFRDETNSPWEWTDEEGYSCLHRACFLNLNIIVNLILEEMKLRLGQGQITGTVGLLPMEIEKFVNKKTVNDSRALHFASYRGNVEIIKLLIANGADLKITNDQGLDVIHMAAQGDQPSSLIYFKEVHNLSIIAKDKSGNTPLHWACYVGSENFLSFFLSYVDLSSITSQCQLIDINIQNSVGLTPMHLAVISEKIKIIKRLSYKGAVRNIKDKQGRTPYILAVEKNKKTISEFLNVEDSCISSNCLMRSQLEKTERSISNMLLFIFLHGIIESCVFFLILPHLKLCTVSIIYVVMFIMTMFLFVILSCSNPGYEGFKYNTGEGVKILIDLVEKNISIDDYCPYCYVIKDDKNKLKHCYYCNKCISQYDHHCFWVNNCIGKNNMNLFFIFISFVCLNLILQICIGLYGLFKNDTLDASNNNITEFYFPPYLDFLRKLNLYDKYVKTFLSSLLIITGICFILPIGYLWIKNAKNLFLKLRKIKKSKSDEKKLKETIIEDEDGACAEENALLK